MKRKIVDLGREMIVGLTKVEDKVYLDFFTKDGIKVINLNKYEFDNMLDFFKDAIQEKEE